MEIYQQDTLPEPMTMLRATAEANNLSALASAQEKYTENMEKVRVLLYNLIYQTVQVKGLFTFCSGLQNTGGE